MWRRVRARWGSPGPDSRVIDLSVRRLYCENASCCRATFVEQVEGLTRRYQRRTLAPQRAVDAMAVVPAGSARAGHVRGGGVSTATR